MSLPKKLKDDAITAVAFEIRFNSHQVEELIVGRIAEWAHENFPNAEMTRTGAADIPLPLRKSNPQFLNLSTLDITVDKSATSRRIIRIGNSVLGYILRGQYCGWDDFELELSNAVDGLFNSIEISRVVRLGLRYTNAFRPDLHLISGLADINFQLVVDEEHIVEQASATFAKQVSDNHKVAYRIGTTEYWNEVMPEGTTVIADFDVHSVLEIEPEAPDQIKAWIREAHEFEKAAFFSILPDRIIDKLKDNS